ncbi:MAG: protein kinase [Ktedonobacteraceae bacterium]|nr:protein kinase [Ktedonobacteraceae bacterium]
MNAEALIGTVLGTCTLQKLVGQGGMGAVYLAQQSRPRRQVAVKVLLPMTPLSPNQLAAFLERFRRETDAAASLEHPNIMPVHEYGERDGIAYLVMPYIGGGTLRDELERVGQLPLERVVNFLDQLAAALDCAHEHGVVHRDIKPANIMLTSEGRLLLTDFGLVKIIAEGQVSQMRLTGPGAPVGTPDYMSPEQVIGEDVDTRADLYSLGVILYQMVTGTTPFQGETPMQIAAQHLQIPPPSPQMLRPDLPIAAEQAILRALAKRPSERYSHAQDLANAFRAALIGTGIPLNMNTASMPVIPPSGSTGRLFVPKGTFGATRPTAVLPAVDRPPAAQGTGLLSKAALGGGTNALPAMNAPEAPLGGGGLLSRTGKFPLVGSGSTGQLQAARLGTGQMPATAASTGQIDMPIPADEPLAPAGTSSTTRQTTTGQQPVLGKSPTGASPAVNGNGSNTVKLTGPVKVVKVPVAGQPGKYVTGILPTARKEQSHAEEERRRAKPWVRWISFAITAVLLLAAAVGIWSYRMQQSSLNGKQNNLPFQQTASTPNPAATAAAQATATAQANIFVQDALDKNTNGWPTTPSDTASYAFKDGAYHITVSSDKGGGAAILPRFTEDPGQLIVYTLTAQEIKGNDGVANNTFGLIFRYNQQQVGGKTISTFYSFEVENTKNGNYRLWKYDGSKGNGADAWKDLWHARFGSEFHQGQGAKATNVFKIFLNKDTFTFSMNGKMLKGSVKDSSYTKGQIGMMVNLKGTEVAFKNLAVTRS